MFAPEEVSSRPQWNGVPRTNDWSSAIIHIAHVGDVFEVIAQIVDNVLWCHGWCLSLDGLLSIFRVEMEGENFKEVFYRKVLAIRTLQFISIVNIIRRPSHAVLTIAKPL